MIGGPYREGAQVPEHRLIRDVAYLKRRNAELQEEFWEYKQRRWLWFQTSTALLLILYPLYRALLWDLAHISDKWEPKHVCDPAPACELKLRAPLDSAGARH